MKTFIFFMGTLPRRSIIALIMTGVFLWLLPEFEQAVDVNSLVYSGTVFLTMYLIAKLMFWTNCNHDTGYEELGWVPVSYFRTGCGRGPLEMHRDCVQYLYLHSISYDSRALMQEINRYYDYRGWPR